jgi:hypothetical protein
LRGGMVLVLAFSLILGNVLVWPCLWYGFYPLKSWNWGGL